MYFAEQLGINPAAWLRYEPLDRVLNYNACPTLSWEAVLVNKFEFHITAIRTLLAIFSTLIFGILHRGIPSATGTYTFGNIVFFSAAVSPGTSNASLFRTFTADLVPAAIA